MKLVHKAIDALYEGPIKEALMIIEEMKKERISVKVLSPQHRTPNVQESEAESPNYEKSTPIPSPVIPDPIFLEELISKKPKLKERTFESLPESSLEFSSLSTGMEVISAHNSKLSSSVRDDMVICDNYEVFKHPIDSTLSLRIDAFDPFSVELFQERTTITLLESYITNSKFITSMGEEKKSYYP